MRSLLRAVVEAVLPWFDRAEQTRHRTALERDLAASRRVRERAHQELMRGSFARATERLGK